MRLLFGRCSSTKFQISLISQTRYSAHVPIEFQLKMSETPKSEQTAPGVRAARKVYMQKYWVNEQTKANLWLVWMAAKCLSRNN